MYANRAATESGGEGDAGEVGWDQWRFAAPAHHEFTTFPFGGPALEATWSHPTLKLPTALVVGGSVVSKRVIPSGLKAHEHKAQGFSPVYGN